VSPIVPRFYFIISNISQVLLIKGKYCEHKLKYYNFVIRRKPGSFFPRRLSCQHTPCIPVHILEYTLYSCIPVHSQSRIHPVFRYTYFILSLKIIIHFYLYPFISLYLFLSISFIYLNLFLSIFYPPFCLSNYQLN